MECSALRGKAWISKSLGQTNNTKTSKRNRNGVKDVSLATLDALELLQLCSYIPVLSIIGHSLIKVLNSPINSRPLKSLKSPKLAFSTVECNVGVLAYLAYFVRGRVVFSGFVTD